MLHRVALSRVRLFPVMMLITMLIHQGYAFEYEDPYADKPKKQDKPPSISYVTPIEDTFIPTPAPEKAVWVQPMQSYSCIGKANIGWLIIYTDSQGIKRIGLVPWRDRMNNVTAEENGDNLKINPGAIVQIGQGGVLLKTECSYQLIEEVGNHQKVLYCSEAFTQSVLVAKNNMQPCDAKKANKEEVMFEGEWMSPSAAIENHKKKEALRLKMIEIENKVITMAIAEAESCNTYEEAIKVLQTTIESHSNSPNIIEARNALSRKQSGLEDYRINTARGLVRVNSEWMTPDDAAVARDWIRGQRTGIFSMTVNERRWNNRQQSTSTSMFGGNSHSEHYASRQSAGAAADRLSQNNVGRIESARESLANGSMELPASVSERWYPVPCREHNNCWVIIPMRRGPNNKKWYDIVDDTRGVW